MKETLHGGAAGPWAQSKSTHRQAPADPGGTQGLGWSPLEVQVGVSPSTTQLPWQERRAPASSQPEQSRVWPSPAWHTAVIDSALALPPAHHEAQPVVPRTQEPML